jgi:hypothetical protein
MNRKGRTVTTMCVTAIAIAFLLASAGTPATTAAVACRTDQQQWRNQFGVGFGNKVAVRQSFVPAAANRICRVKVMITKNNPMGGGIRLQVLAADLSVRDSAIIPAVPMGTSIQVFEFGCDGAPLVGFPFFYLKLDAPDSPGNAYSWRAAGGNPYALAGNRGLAWTNNPGNWALLGGGTIDFAFEVYMCV